ncbi:MAG: hypothetical protein AAGD14_06940 [Planctomycetota bacterium]
MRRAALLLLALPLFGGIAAAQAGSMLRHQRTEIAWGGKLPDKPWDECAAERGAAFNKPLLVYVESRIKTQDQQRFDDALDMTDQLRLVTKFFDCVKLGEDQARKSKFLSGIKFKTPAVFVFSPDRSTWKKTDGRPSAMKAYTIMRQVGQPAWETKIKPTLQEAKVLLGRYDQIDDAQNAISIKQRRLNDYLGKGKTAKAKALQKSLDKDVKKRADHLAETDKLWKELWKLERRKPE